jgi:hypothetical protein
MGRVSLYGSEAVNDERCIKNEKPLISQGFFRTWVTVRKSRKMATLMGLEPTPPRQGEHKNEETPVFTGFCRLLGRLCTPRCTSNPRQDRSVSTNPRRLSVFVFVWLRPALLPRDGFTEWNVRLFLEPAADLRTRPGLIAPLLLDRIFFTWERSEYV